MFSPTIHPVRPAHFATSTPFYENYGVWLPPLLLALHNYIRWAFWFVQVYLDPKARNDTEYKLETFAGVYRKLSGKDVVFEYPIIEA